MKAVQTITLPKLNMVSEGAFPEVEQLCYYIVKALDDDYEILWGTYSEDEKCFRGSVFNLGGISTDIKNVYGWMDVEEADVEVSIME